MRHEQENIWDCGIVLGLSAFQVLNSLSPQYSELLGDVFSQVTALLAVNPFPHYLVVTPLL